MEKHIKDFLSYCEVERGHSDHTIVNYDHYLKRFNNWAKANQIIKVSQINLDMIKKYRLYLNRLKGINKKTQAFHIIALRSFLKYLAQHDIKTLAAEKIELPDIPEKQITFMEEDEVDKLLSQPNTSKIIGLRDKAILEVLFSTGLRVSELVKLNWDEINFNKKEFSIIGKGGKARIVFLSDNALSAIKKYLAKRTDNDKALFISHQTIRKQIKKQKIKNNNKNTDDNQKRRKSDVSRFRLTTRSIQRIVKKYAIQAGLTKKITPHTLRHSFGTDLLRSVADLRAVQQLLGHSSITTTQIYTHVTDQHLREVHQAFHGRRRKSNQNTNNK